MYRKYLVDSPKEMEANSRADKQPTKERKEVEKTPLNIYTHSGANFDVIPIFRVVLTASSRPIEDMICSNGMFVS